MNKELKEQAHKEFDEKFSHIRVGKRMILLSEAYPYTYTELKSFIDSLIDKTVQISEERIVGIIEKAQEVLRKDLTRENRETNTDFIVKAHQIKFGHEIIKQIKE